MQTSATLRRSRVAQHQLCVAPADRTTTVNGLVRGMEARLIHALHQLNEEEESVSVHSNVQDDLSLSQKDDAHFSCTDDEFEQETKGLDSLQQELAKAESAFLNKKDSPSEQQQQQQQQEPKSEEDEEPVVAPTLLALDRAEMSGVERKRRRSRKQQKRAMQEEDDEEADEDLMILEELRRDWLAQREAAMADLMELSYSGEESDVSTIATDEEDDYSVVVKDYVKPVAQIVTNKVVVDKKNKKKKSNWLTILGSLVLCLLVLLAGPMTVKHASQETESVMEEAQPSVVSTLSTILSEATSSRAPSCVGRKRFRRNTRMLVVDRNCRA